MKNWDSIQEEVMFKALKAKFLNHVSLRDSLLATGDRLIVNDSENEFWGWGKDGKGWFTVYLFSLFYKTIFREQQTWNVVNENTL